MGTAVRALAAVAAAPLLALPAGAAPYVPRDDAEVLERLPVRPRDPVARELGRLRAELARDPRSAERAVQLAQRYFDLAAAEGDPRYIGYAQAALQPWWDRDDAPPRVRVVRALLRQYGHDFAGALADLDAALRADPADAQAWAWRAAIHMVQADYDAARKDCAALARIGTELGAAGCMAYLDGTTGKAGEAYRALAAALERDSVAGPAERVWMLTRLAELALRAGDPALAERHFRAALEQGVTDQFLLAAYADFLLDRNRPGEVVALLRDWVRSDVLLLRLALAEQATGAPAAKEHIQALKARFDAAALRGDRLHQQEEARFNLQLAGDAKKALALARENWKLQREPRDARILIEAALAAGDAAAAQPALDWLERSRHEDPVLRRIAAQLRGR